MSIRSEGVKALLSPGSSGNSRSRCSIVLDSVADGWQEIKAKIVLDRLALPC